MTKEHAYAYEAGYKDGATNYELDHCPSCPNLVSLQEALDENAKLRDELDKWECLTKGIELPEYPMTQFQPKDLERENARLRELARYALRCATGEVDCESCPYGEPLEHGTICKAETVARELGIEVEQMSQGATSMTRYERAVLDAAMYKEESEQWRLTAEQLEAENSKLRELVRDMHGTFHLAKVQGLCQWGPTIERRMRDLGVEVR